MTGHDGECSCNLCAGCSPLSLRILPCIQVCWSPLSPSHFLTASADGTVRLWREGHPRSLWTFQAPGAKGEVADVAFCPTAATMFAAAAGNTLQASACARGGGEEAHSGVRGCACLLQCVLLLHRSDCYTHLPMAAAVGY